MGTPTRSLERDPALASGGWDVLAKYVGLKMRRMRQVEAVARIGTGGCNFSHTSHETGDDGPLWFLSVDYYGFNPTFTEVADDERYQRIMQAIRILNPVDAIIVKKHFGFGCDPMLDAEIAKEMGVSRTAVYLRIKRAYRVLSPLLESFAPRATA